MIRFSTARPTPLAAITIATVLLLVPMFLVLAVLVGRQFCEMLPAAAPAPVNEPTVGLPETK